MRTISGAVANVRLVLGASINAGLLLQTGAGARCMEKRKMEKIFSQLILSEVLCAWCRMSSKLDTPLDDLVGRNRGRGRGGFRGGSRGGFRGVARGSFRGGRGHFRGRGGRGGLGAKVRVPYRVCFLP